MRRALVLGAAVALIVSLPAAVFADVHYFQVIPRKFDPARTFLVQATWLDGIGCPTGAKVAAYPATEPTGTYSDLACPTGDPRDRTNQGLLLAKTGPLANNAAAVADIKGVQGQMVSELGYDIRKFDTSLSPFGSHCGAGAPRFNLTTVDSTGTEHGYFIACNGPPATMQSPGNGFTRLRWGAAGIVVGYEHGALVPVVGKIKALQIVFDEGTDAGPDNFGLAVLDNIDVNGVLVGRGPQGGGGGDNGGGDNGGGDNGN